MTARDRTPTPTWVLVPPETDLPAEWSARCLPLLLVPLLPREAAVLIERKRQRQGDDPTFLSLVARATPVREIARRLEITDRSVFRRLALLRDQFGVRSNAQLATELARRGF